MDVLVMIEAESEAIFFSLFLYNLKDTKRARNGL
jgi:hypothetical protein